MAVRLVTSFFLLLQIFEIWCMPIKKDIYLDGYKICTNCSSEDDYFQDRNWDPDRQKRDDHFYIGPGIIARYWTPHGKITTELNFEAKRYKSLGFYSERSTKIIFPGWFYDDDYWGELKDAYFNYGTSSDFNVIVLDYQTAFPNNYHSAVLKLPEIAESIAKLIDFLVWEVGIEQKGIHLIGHCIGAHLAAYTANHVTFGYIQRITALDPSKDDFEEADFSERLDPSDAGFVDVIHTNTLRIGIERRCGDVDFFVDSGTWQSKCLTESSVVTRYSGRCSHLKAYSYYRVSIENPKCMSAYPCSGYHNYRYYRENYCHAIKEIGEHFLEQDGLVLGNYYIMISYWWDASWNKECFWLWWKIFG